jgi:hypothetical protein
MEQKSSGTDHSQRAMRFELYRLTVHAERPLACLEDLEHTPGIGAVRFGRPASLDAFEKVLAFDG